MKTIALAALAKMPANNSDGASATRVLAQVQQQQRHQQKRQQDR
jgi:hypothetical protein